MDGKDHSNSPCPARRKKELTHEYPEKRVHLQFFRCRWVANEPQPLGCPAFAWITRDQLGDYQFPAADARLLEMLRHSSELWQPDSGAV